MGSSHTKNEDYCLTPDKHKEKWATQGAMLVVCDGAGANGNGDIVSRMAAKTLMEKWYASEENSSLLDLLTVIDATNTEILKTAVGKLKGMASTLAVVVVKEDSFLLASLGDSRIYHFFDKQLEQLTEDHTLAQHLYQQGYLEKVELSDHVFSHILLNGIGFEVAFVDVGEFLISDGAMLLLCSDGLSHFVTSNDLKRTLESDELLEIKVSELCKTAIKNGGSDDVSCILVDFEHSRHITRTAAKPSNQAD